MFIQTLDSSHCEFGACQKWAPTGRIGDFGNILNGFRLKAHACLDRPQYRMSAVCIAKLWNCILSEVCMKQTTPHSTVSPQIWCIKRMKGWFTHTRFVGKILKSKLVEPKKFGLICFPRICLQGLIYCDQEPLWLLPVIEDDWYFLLVHIRLSTRCKIWFTLGLFATYFSLKSLRLSLKSHMNVL